MTLLHFLTRFSLLVFWTGAPQTVVVAQSIGSAVLLSREETASHADADGHQHEGESPVHPISFQDEHVHHYNYDHHAHNHGHDHHGEQSHRQDQEVPQDCGTPDPTVDDLATSLEVEEDFFAHLIRFVEWLWSLFFPPGAIQIPIYYHVISSPRTGNNGPSDALVQGQNDHLNAAYAGSGFAFSLKEITRSANDDWYSATVGSTQERSMKSTLRRGGPESLNVYINAGGGFCGYATFPASYMSSPSTDGVIMNNLCFFGSSFPDKQGDTLVHEVGHWLGLIHTFSNGCNDPGDGIDDTPAQLRPTLGCPSSPPDSCPGGGPDPIYNYMDYSADNCRSQFTQGQMNRMMSQWNAYRT